VLKTGRCFKDMQPVLAFSIQGDSQIGTLAVGTHSCRRIVHGAVVPVRAVRAVHPRLQPIE